MMSHASSDNLRFTGPEEEQLVRYRDLNKLALVALLVGLASVLALVHPLLTLVPVVGVACALISLRTIRSNPEIWTGAWLAVIGLVLSLFFLGWGFGWSATRPGRLATQAQRFADDWFKLAQRNELYAAHQLRIDTPSRAPVTARLDDYYRSQPADMRDAFQSFSKSPVIEALVNAGPEHPPEFVGVARTESAGLTDTLYLRYRLPAVKDQPQWSILISVKREGEDRWQVFTISGNKGEEWPEA